MKRKINWILVSMFLCLGLAIPIVSASDYFVYSEIDTGLTNGSYGPDGYVGADGINRVIFYSPDWSSNTANAYIYKVSIPAGADPNMHPDNPDATGPIALRTFTFEKSFNLGVNPSHESEFYVDAENNEIYLGASVGIRKYVYDTITNNYVFNSQVAPPSPNEEGYSTQSLSYDPGTNTWYAGSIAWNYDPGVTLRDIWKYDGSQGNSGTWVLAFNYTTSETTASHHDGMGFINGLLYLADYQGDYVKQYTTEGTFVKKFTYQPLGHELEGMGFGALKHFWAGSHGTKITEFGGGALQVALEGIPDQCVASGQSFATIDLNTYATGTQPFSWTYSGASNLIVNIDASNIATITSPSGWTGSETITFTVTDSNGVSASDDATFTVDPVPVIGDIPDQTTPFTPIKLDSYLSGPIASTVTWTSSGNVNLVVVIDPVTHIATVSNPLNSSNPETITFTATANCCGNPYSDSDSAIFSPNNAKGRMTGGGSVFTAAGVRVTHGFELNCDASKTPNNLEINWGKNNKFHLETLTSASCSDDPAIVPKPPTAGFDTYVGTGTGRYNGVSGYTAVWTFTDAGEPGKKDFAKIVIKDSLGNTDISVSGNLNTGNQQAHDE